MRKVTISAMRVTAPRLRSVVSTSVPWTCIRGNSSFQFPSSQTLAFHAAAASTEPNTGGPTVAFIGLGAMGYQIAHRLAVKPMTPDSVGDGSLKGARLHRGESIHRGMEQHVMRNVMVWNRTKSTAARHAQEFNSRDISCEDFSADNLGLASVVLMCLPTSDVTFDIVKDMAPHLNPDCILVDCCTGHPTTTRKIAAWLGKERPGIRYMDCPISGGPGGASQGKLAAMLGGDPEAAQIILPHLTSFAAKIVHLGPVGAGHAVKAINNACNVSNLLCLHEGLLALKNMGVDASLALEVINKSSGRSLMSEVRVLEEIVTGEFNYGFKLGLMAKDVGIAVDLMDEFYPSAQVYKRTAKIHFDAMSAGTVNFDSDYTEIVKYQEIQAGAMLRASETKSADSEPSTASASPKAIEARMKALSDENAALHAELLVLRRSS